jgi:hypothetical protein
MMNWRISERKGIVKYVSTQRIKWWGHLKRIGGEQKQKQ